MFNRYFLGGGKIVSLLDAKVISGRFKTSCPMAYGIEGGRDFEREREKRQRD